MPKRANMSLLRAFAASTLVFAALAAAACSPRTPIPETEPDTPPVAMPEPSQPKAADAEVALTPFEPTHGEEGFIVEAEEYESKWPRDAEDFARPEKSDSASGGYALGSFVGDRRRQVYYPIDLSQGGTYRFWLRYAAAAPADMAVALVLHGREPQFNPVRLPATGAEPEDWGWARLFELNAPAGRHILVLSSAPIRPDCLCVTTSDRTPGGRRGTPSVQSSQER